MVFQGTVPVTSGVLFTSWNLSARGLPPSVPTLVSGGLIYATLRRRGTLHASGPMIGDVFYAAFLVAAVIFSVS